MMCDQPRLRYDVEGNPAGELDEASMRFAEVKMRGRISRDEKRRDTKKTAPSSAPVPNADRARLTVSGKARSK